MHVCFAFSKPTKLILLKISCWIKIHQWIKLLHVILSSFLFVFISISVLLSGINHHAQLLPQVCHFSYVDRKQQALVASAGLIHNLCGLMQMKLTFVNHLKSYQQKSWSSWACFPNIRHIDTQEHLTTWWPDRCRTPVAPSTERRSAGMPRKSGKLLAMPSSPVEWNLLITVKDYKCTVQIKKEIYNYTWLLFTANADSSWGLTLCQN